MGGLLSKVLVLLLLFAGETLMIYAEMIGARSHSVDSRPFFEVFSKMYLLVLVSGGFLIAGYMFGFSVFRNIWIVSVASITSILIMEPLLAYLIFQQLPTRGALIGLILGALGFAAAMFI